MISMTRGEVRGIEKDEPIGPLCPIWVRTYGRGTVEDNRELTSLLHGRRLFCPFCETWDPIEAFPGLKNPPKKYEHLTAPIVKHAGPNGCKMLVAPLIK